MIINYKAGGAISIVYPSKRWFDEFVLWYENLTAESSNEEAIEIGISNSNLKK